MSLDFVAFDVETANADRGSICAMGFSTVRGGQVIHQESWLCQPPDAVNYFDDFNIGIHGITPAKVRNSRTFQEALQDAASVIGGLPVVAHNASFDMGAIREACEWSELDWPSIRYACTMVLARPLIQLPSYRLPLLCGALGIEVENHHDAEADAVAAARLCVELARLADVDSLDELLAATGVRYGLMDPASWDGCRRVRRPGQAGGWHYGAAPAASAAADPDHPFFGQVMVFTGALSIRREVAWQLVADRGATIGKGVTKETTILVIGDGFVGNTADEFATGKAQKAVEWLGRGHHIEVLNEGDFLELLRASSGERGPAIRRPMTGEQT